MIKVAKKSVILKHETATAGQPSDQPQPNRALPDCAGGDHERDCSNNNTRMFHPWPEETPLKIKLRNVGHYILN